MANGNGGAPVWYEEGLRFKCLPDCGGCCVDHEGYAYVYLDEDDVDRLAAYLGLTRRRFLLRYTEKDEGHRVLRMDQPRCPFLDGKRCSVYTARPDQCRTFPFWPENLASRRKWDRLSSFCPGINQGRTHSLRVIRRHLATYEA